MRFNIFENNRLVGQDYQRENGKWSHKWYVSKDKGFERGSWPGRVQGDNQKSWVYIEAK